MARPPEPTDAAWALAASAAGLGITSAERAVNNGMAMACRDSGKEDQMRPAWDSPVFSIAGRLVGLGDEGANDVRKHDDRPVVQTERPSRRTVRQ